MKEDPFKIIKNWVGNGKAGGGYLTNQQVQSIGEELHRLLSDPLGQTLFGKGEAA